MKLCGDLKIGDQEYFLYWKDLKSSETVTIFSKYHLDDIYEVEMGLEPKHPIIVSAYNVMDYCNPDYVIESLQRLKISNKVKAYGEISISESFYNALYFAKNYKFHTTDVMVNNTETTPSGIVVNFVGVDGQLSYKYRKCGNFYESLELKYADILIKLSEVNINLDLSSFHYEEVATQKRNKILNKTIKTIDYQMLCDSIDMSWFKEGDTLKKNYQSIKSAEEFELKIMTPLVSKIASLYGTNEKVDVAVDTETTGLMIYNLSKSNEDKDHCVAVPICWEEDNSYVIFTDMEFFNNVPNDYVSKRLGELFNNFKGDRLIEIYDVTMNEFDLKQMNLFDDDENSLKTNKTVLKSVKISRKNINLIGHNVMFDKRVFIDLKQDFYFDDDTLQMAFDLNPKTVKGSNKLKVLTRKIFGHETPELTDILGKGNEDKYRYLAVELVAIIYGCADADYTLKLFHYLKSVMSKRMYTYYKMQDVPMLNILPRSEYYGLNTMEEDVLKLADTTLANIERLKSFTYEYVGVFVDVYKQRSIIDAKKKSGFFLSEDEYRNAIASIKPSNDLVFQFEFTPTELRHVLFDILKYPIKAWTTGKKPQPKLDKYAMKKLLQEKRNSSDEHFNRLEHDILSCDASEEEYNYLCNSSKESDKKKAKQMVLISAKEFNSLKYPLALILSKYAELNKEYTGYYKPIKETNLEGKIFKSYSLARIETRRISNPAQTMKGSLKALIRSYSDDYYMCDFDMSQVEYRIMLSLAGHMLMVDRMKDPERDYHTETASLINNIPAHKVSKKVRKKAKSVSFGVPYGLGEYTLCENLFGSINDDTLFETRMLLAKWADNNRPIMDFLNKERDNALLARAMSDELRDFMDAWEKDDNGNYVLDSNGNKVPRPTGFVYNKLGFYRTFDLSDIDLSKEAAVRRNNGIYTKEEGIIRRPAGNFPIQSYAAELFRIILIRFYNRCEEEGINDKIIWHMLIHDELLCSVHKSVHPFLMYKIIKESCMITIKDHTYYFVGINIGNTWAETKDDEREAPVYFVDRVIKRWDSGEFGNGPFWFDDPWNDLIKDERAKYVDDRIWEVIHEVQPDIDTAPINIPLILQNFSNYTVRAYVDSYKMNYDVTGIEDAVEEQDRIWVSRFETWALGHFEKGKPLINYDGNLVVLRKREELPQAKEVEEVILDYEELFENDSDSSDGYWSFDVSEANNQYDAESEDESEEQKDSFSYEEDSIAKASATSIAQLIKKESKYKHLNVMYNQVLINVDVSSVSKVKEFLSPNISKDGLTVIFKYAGAVEKWLKINNSVNYKSLDNLISSLENSKNIKVENGTYKPTMFNRLGNSYVIKLKNDKCIDQIVSILAPYKDDSGYSFILDVPNRGLLKVKNPVLVSFKELDMKLKDMEVIRCR